MNFFKAKRQEALEAKRKRRLRRTLKASRGREAMLQGASRSYVCSLFCQLLICSKGNCSNVEKWWPSHLLVWALVWLTLSLGDFLASGEVTSTETVIIYQSESSQVLWSLWWLSYSPATWSPQSDKECQSGSYVIQNRSCGDGLGGASLQQIQLINASSHCDHWCEFWRVSTWSTTYEGMTASKHKIFSIMSWMSRILTALCS